MTSISRPAPARRRSASSFVQEFRTEILAAWHPRVLYPELLDEIAAIADGTGPAALHRLPMGFELALVVRELSELRGALLDVWHREGGDTGSELRAIELAIDRAIGVAVARYTEAHDRASTASAARADTLSKLESLLAASTAGIAFLDRDLRYLRLNEALARINGRPSHEHIGKTPAEIFPYGSAVEPLLRRVLESGEPLLNFEVVEPGVEPAVARAFLLNYFPLRSVSSGDVVGVGGIVLDVTDAKRARDALQVEQTRTQSILEHAPAAIWVKDPEGRIVLANHRLADALGHPYEEIIGRSSSEVLPPEIAREHEAHDRIVLGEQRAIEVEESPDGVRTFLSIKFPIPGTPPLVGGIATEITDRKRMEAELHDAIRARDDLLAVVSHDLRNPLSTVQLGAALMLGQLGADPRWRRHLDSIQRAATRMKTLIDDLLDSASIRAGRLQLDIRPERADVLTLEAVELHQPTAREKGIELARRCEHGDVELACDRGRVLQVFGNLLGNAIKFCRAGDRITVSCERAGSEVRFSVTDTGPGIEPEAVARLFDRYWSGSEHTKLGVGLGLYICRGIVEGHGGRIWVESTPGAGAAFSFTLPIR